MKKNFKLMAMAVAAMVAVTFTAFNADDDCFAELRQDEVNPETRSVVNPNGEVTITFDDFDELMMAYTSKSDNWWYIPDNQCGVCNKAYVCIDDITVE